ncbi:MAG: gluconeogenesis factor YvcK family protein [Desulfocapsaceae bacterium]|jgi:uncharacterized cofD-like protein|nr:gluconeogenesis factor YvcK family protein [Desulfocapsaceae bacterium]
MVKDLFKEQNRALIEQLNSKNLSAFDLIPQRDIREKLIDLVLRGIPEQSDYESSILLKQLYRNLSRENVDSVRVVVFGGGTGLSNIIGGDCRQSSWKNNPFNGLKEVFPETRAVVCITDDGGSTGELLKDLPVIALGDIRHVLLSSIQLKRLAELYDLNSDEAKDVARVLSSLFNFRFSSRPESTDLLLRECGAEMHILPAGLSNYIKMALDICFHDPRCRPVLSRTHCLGNIIVLSVFISTFSENDPDADTFRLDTDTCERLLKNLSECAKLLGAAEDAVLPSTLTPAQLRFLYTNGVQVSGELKSSSALRGFPVDKVFVDFSGTPYVSERLLDYIKTADILIMAPGSLYSSIIPVLQVPGIVDAVRQNSGALKLLISNLWVQAGETDQSISDPDRKFHISDMIRAYDRNLPGGTQGLFDQILCLALKDVPGSVIQNYAVEGKIPIYLDREVLSRQGFEPIECGFFSKNALAERHVIQHDPAIVAQTVKTLFLARKLMPGLFKQRHGETADSYNFSESRKIDVPSTRYRQIHDRFEELDITIGRKPLSGHEQKTIRTTLADVVWNHKDIPLSHLDNIKGISCIAVDEWRRDQSWDNVFSFYDPEDCLVKIRRDRLADRRGLEISFLITVGQALLGNYAAKKKVETIEHNQLPYGRVFQLYLTAKKLRKCYFSGDELHRYLGLARMVKQDEGYYSRLINGEEGFTPPGLLFGVMYAWYLDNSFASYIEYKMSVMKVRQTDLIPEQMITMKRRMELIGFFRQTVFGKEIQPVKN